MNEARRELDEGLATIRREELHNANAVGSEMLARPVTKSGEPVPAHLLWNDVSPIQQTSIKSKKTKKKKATGWGLSFVAPEGASAEARGVSEITLQNLPGYSPPSVEAIGNALTATPADVDMEDATEHEQPRANSCRRNRLFVLDDDE